VKKIASLGASGGQITEVTSKLTLEEKALFEKVRQNVESWKKDILGSETTN
jgi:DNA replication initiation complex subunit (GINS family)